MSFTLAAKVMGLKVGSLPRKMVLLKLADQANDDGLCWPSYQTIAEACEISRRSVIRHIQKLEEDGYLTITKTYDKANQKNFSNRYNLTLDRGDRLSLVTGEAPSGDSVTLPSDTVTPEPINEPINKPINKDIGAKKGKSKRSSKKEDVFEPVKPEQVSDQVWNDLLALRKKKRAVESQTAWTRINNSIERAQQATGHTLENIFSYWVMRAWAGFDEKWYLNAHPQQPTNNYQGNGYENHQPANSQTQPKQSSAELYAAKYAEQRRQREAANPTATGCDRGYIYDMEAPL